MYNERLFYRAGSLQTSHSPTSVVKLHVWETGDYFKQVI